MSLKIVFFLISFIICCDRYDFVIGKPMVGPNVRYVNSGQFQFIVAIAELESAHSDPGERHICTGSLITRQDVLTAAHCFYEQEIQQLQVIVGSIDFTNGTRYDIYWWITYSSWANLLGKRLEFRVNDIANIRLLVAVPNHINLGVLSPLLISDLYNKQVIIAAWGRNENHTVPHRMRTVELTVLEFKECENRVKRLNNGKKVKMHYRHICTHGDPYAIMYFGDSGGPVLYQNMIIAIHKSTIPFPGQFINQRKINVHTTINWYTDFIYFVINPDFDCFDHDVDLLLT